MPNMHVFRPADANETVACRELAISRKEPAVLVLTRQALPIIDPAVAIPGATRGGYILAEAGSGRPEAVILATGSEVSLALSARDLLEAEGIATRVVSMPSWEIFEAQARDYRESVIPPYIGSRVSVEAASISDGLVEVRRV